MRRSVLQWMCILLLLLLIPITGMAQSVSVQYDRLIVKQNTLIKENARLQQEIDKEEAKLRQLQNAAKVTANLPLQTEAYLKDVVQETQKRVEKGLPYDHSVRVARLQQLQQFLNEPASTQDKLRRTIEVLLLEAQYGTSIEVYPQQIQLEDTLVLVNMVRLGNVGLYYTTVDQKRAGYFNKETGQFEPLPAKYVEGILAAEEIAQKRRPAELILLPVGKVVGP